MASSIFEYVGLREEVCKPTTAGGVTEFHYFLLTPDGAETHVASGTNQGALCGDDFSFTFHYSGMGDELSQCHTQNQLCELLRSKISCTDKENIGILLGNRTVLGKRERVSSPAPVAYFTGFKEQKFLSVKGVPCSRFYLVPNTGEDIFAATEVGGSFAQVSTFETTHGALKAASAIDVYRWLRAHVLDNENNIVNSPSEFIAAPDWINEEPTPKKPALVETSKEPENNVDRILKRQRSEIENFVRREMLAFLRQPSAEDISEILEDCKKIIESINARGDMSLSDLEVTEVVGCLRRLKSIHMTIPLLESSGIAYCIKPLREHSHRAISSLASSLLREWKDQTDNAILQFTNLSPYDSLVPEGGIEKVHSSVENSSPTGSSPRLDRIISPTKAEMLLTAEKRVLREREAMNRVEQIPAEHRASHSASRGKIGRVNVRELDPPGKGKKRCHECGLIIGSPTRICPQCQVAQIMSVGNHKKDSSRLSEGDEADSDILNLKNSLALKAKAMRANSEIIIRSPGQPKVNVASLGPDGQIRELAIIWNQQRRKLEGCKYSHIRRIVRAAVDNVVKILISDRGFLAKNIQRLNIQYIQKLFNKVMYMKQAKDKKSKGEARTYIMAAMDDIHRSMLEWQRVLQTVVRSDEWDLPMLADAESPNSSEHSIGKPDRTIKLEASQKYDFEANLHLWNTIQRELQKEPVPPHGKLAAGEIDEE